MVDLTIRNLDDRVIERLKAQARANHRSLEGEVRHLLTRWLSRPVQIAEFRERTRKLVSRTARARHTDSVAMLREDRAR